MSTVAVVIKTEEKSGVLHGIADKLYERNYNIIYTHLFLEDNFGKIYMEITGVDDVSGLLRYISNIPNVVEVHAHKTLYETFGKRVIVVGDGEIMAKTLQGGIMEAELHNAHGETISVDGMIIGGGVEIQEAIHSLDKLPRINALVLSGSMMGGLITDEIIKLKENNNDLKIVSIDMLGDLDSVVDLVVNDPVQAGAMAVKLISDIDSYDNVLLDNKFLKS